ncbi:DUF6624 domain-containing protein [Pedobacter jejuensis]|uniref:Tetratricopeptide repeat protein n=1 Tax=Pedobacter jejuensis TaxID=1268550 RepID=A0A3N0BQZ9_9SPHI|nr:DUF6624 domain-containing protein [Pedobacter jejuensis]RNL51075.1 hypothetical protein D7004_15235 [Pedobacter jejuensis]
MKKGILLIFVFLNITVFAFAQDDYKQLVSQAERLYKSKDYIKSKDAYLLAFEKERNNKTDLYNAACAAALAGDRLNAFKLLNLSIDAGWINIEHFKKDSDLISLHSLPEWEKVVSKLHVRINQIETNYNKEAKAALEEVYKTDQGIRVEYIAAQKKEGYQSKKVDSLSKLMIYHDSLNTITVTKILDKYGWLGEDKVGNQSNTLFLVIQHSDLVIQQKYLPIMRIAVKNGKAKPSALALLEDRVALSEGKKQIYGSQIRTNPKENMAYVLPLLDPDNVDKRRASVGLGSLAEYVRQWGIVWNVEEYKNQLPLYEKWEKN